MPKREIEILQLLSNGYSNKEMAYNLYLTEGTVKNYISDIYSKLEVTGRHKAVLKAKEEGIIGSLIREMKRGPYPQRFKALRVRPCIN
jgi:DNA-binding NarL/FixJ family response regulator